MSETPAYGTGGASPERSAAPLSRPPGLLALPSYLVSHVARLGHEVLVDAVGGHGLRLPHFATLTALADFGPLPQHVLAERLGFQRSHLGGYLDAVEERGLVRRERDRADRRRQLVALTEEGADLQRRVRLVAEASQDVFLARLTPAERETLATLLRRVLDGSEQSS
ncbi:MarR family winged helix-turn-helix transcriptional regulator [Streptomyces sp. NPDC060184]|uniref:MarR family winged helix-turn-helix transcriptional regulator n=1 Tax=Streptomyces sp. NPDC060184 TaxID=3347064 RepID=UPI0036591D2C